MPLVYRHRKGMPMNATNDLKSRFALIGTYCNNADYKKAQEELDKIEPYCKTPAEKARFHYSRGYINYAVTSQLSALAEYRKGLKEDSDDTLNLKKECAQTQKLIKKEYAEMRRVVINIVHIINQHYSKISEDSKTKAADHTFQLFLGFHQSISPPRADNISLGFPNDDIFLGFEDYFAKLTGEKRENAESFLEEAYHITNRESFFDCI